MLYFLRVNKGYISCLDARDGKVHYNSQKLEGVGDVYASLIGAQNRIYVVGINGTMYVIKHGPTFEVLAQNKLDDNFEASPVIIDNNLYLRGFKYLYCIASK